VRGSAEGRFGDADDDAFLAETLMARIVYNGDLCTWFGLGRARGGCQGWSRRRDVKNRCSLPLHCKLSLQLMSNSLQSLLSGGHLLKFLVEVNIFQ
jgi:hypothetical protein